MEDKEGEDVPLELLQPEGGGWNGIWKPSSSILLGLWGCSY